MGAQSKKYRVINDFTGADLGVYEAETPEGAVEAMLVDAKCDGEPSEGLEAIDVELFEALCANEARESPWSD